MNAKRFLLFICIIFITVYAFAGDKDIKFIYKPKYVTADFIINKINDNETYFKKTFHDFYSVEKLYSEGTQDFIEIIFWGGIKTFKPDIDKFINYLISNIDTIENGISILGFKSKTDFAVKNGIKTTDNEIGNKLLQIWKKGKFSEYIKYDYALSNNKSIEYYNNKKINDNESNIVCGSNYDFFVDRLCSEYLDLVDTGGSFAPLEDFLDFSPTFKKRIGNHCYDIDKLGLYSYFTNHDDSLRIQLWHTPKSCVEYKMDFEDRLVMPKYLGSCENCDIFALVIAPTLEKEKITYERLKNVYLMPLQDSMGKIVEELKKDFIKPERLITDKGFGEIKLGDNITKVYTLMNKKFGKDITFKLGKDIDGIPITQVYLTSGHGPTSTYGRGILSLKHPEGKINSMYIVNDVLTYLSQHRDGITYTTKEGIMIGITLDEFNILTHNNFKEIKRPFNFPDTKEFEYLRDPNFRIRYFKMPIYNNLIFIFTSDAPSYRLTYIYLE